MTTHEEIFLEIQDALDVRLKIRVRYARLYALLSKICAEQSADFASDYSGLFSRLYAVCHEKLVDYHAGDRFRRSARLVLLEPGFTATPCSAIQASIRRIRSARRG